MVTHMEYRPDRFLGDALNDTGLRAVVMVNGRRLHYPRQVAEDLIYRCDLVVKDAVLVCEPGTPPYLLFVASQ